MNYRSVSDLSLLIARNMDRLPRDIDVVVGIPRSGLMVASLIALATNRPMADVAGFCEGRLLASGHTRRHAGLDVEAGVVRRILLIDDSIDTGTSLTQAQRAIAAARPAVEVVTLVAFATTRSAPVDISLEVVPHPRAFEWNIMHHPILERACVDIDGVVCVDPTEDENDDGLRYAQFLDHAKALHLPTRRVGAFVTNRLEKYRPHTERWLEQAGLSYGHLIMLDLPNKAARIRSGSHALHKATFYRQSAFELFVESDVRQASEIARLSGKPVYCLEDRSVHTPGSFTAPAISNRSGQIARSLIWITKSAGKKVVGDRVYGTFKRLAGRA
ncbi:phosphoribosyltransferase family protein [Bosea sp. RAC05]|uniref:phosphoribosyltransferase family protein n=1 Tax=Bosea sp. RAC05 TaxID=1842539 RepID=UPI00083D5899|nr:phosphoribosyltransferase family protein [Bosea sp. RAC05]AOG03250.1 phosphoribosyl transferase domain protein [Bosea sp. RAC05]